MPFAMAHLPNLGGLCMRALAAVPTGALIDKRRAGAGGDGEEEPPKKKPARRPTKKRPIEEGGQPSSAPSKRAQGADAATTKADDAFNAQVDTLVPKDWEGVRVDPEIKNGYWEPDVDEDSQRVIDPPSQKPCCTNPNSR